MKSFLPLMTWVEAQEAARSGAVALVPIGSTDANGPQNATGMDFLISSALAERAAARTGSIYLPPLTYGVSDGLKGFPGTIGFTPQMLGEQVESVVKSLIRGGFEHIAHASSSTLTSSSCGRAGPLTIVPRMVEA